MSTEMKANPETAEDSSSLSAEHLRRFQWDTSLTTNGMHVKLIYSEKPDNSGAVMVCEHELTWEVLKESAYPQNLLDAVRGSLVFRMLNALGKDDTEGRNTQAILAL